MFAVLSLRAERFIILKCDPFRADILRVAYAGTDHRSHLDRRSWISVDLDSDVPPEEIRALVVHSWDEVAATLTRQQKEELSALRADKPAALF